MLLDLEVSNAKSCLITMMLKIAWNSLQRLLIRIRRLAFAFVPYQLLEG